MYCINAREKGEKAWTTIVATGEDIVYDTYEDALYDVGFMKECDVDQGEEWEYDIVEIEER